MLTTLIAAVALGGFQAPGTIQFVVAETSPYHGDSYILPLSNADDIRAARDLIRYGASPDRPSIVSCEITKGADGINRDVLAAGEPLWTWHVSAFLGFADSSAEQLDGWPGLAEDGVYFLWYTDMEGNMVQSDTGQIAFWHYTVTAELGAGPSGPPPAAPTNVTATAQNGGKAKINWLDKSNNEQGLEIERFKLVGGTYSSQAVIKTAANTVTYTDTPGSGSYKYRVRSYNGNGSSLWSSQVSVKVN